nr:MAG TPA: hypothetical protein [Caudoviricetes sp.]
MPGCCCCGNTTVAAFAKTASPKMNAPHIRGIKRNV